MRVKSVLALRKQLQRERQHIKWLEQHLPHSGQLNTARQRVAQLQVLEGLVGSAAMTEAHAATKKSDAEAPLSL